MKIKLRLFAMLLAVMLCVTAFSMPAFAYADDGCTSEPTAAVPAETTVTDTTANSDENAGEDTAKLTPSGNLTLVDDIQTTESTSKQFITSPPGQRTRSCLSCALLWKPSTKPRPA